MKSKIKSGSPGTLYRLILAILLVGMCQYGRAAVPAPTFSPASCTFSTPISVEIHAGEGYDIYYRTDGNTPKVDEEYKYTGPIVISSSTRFAAIAADAAGNTSDIATCTYTCRHGIGEGYDPESPGNPEAPEASEKKYRLTVVSNPTGAGSSYSRDYKAGEQIEVYTNNNTGFEFVNWTIEGEEVSTATSFNYVMPEYDVTFVANFVYNPSSPGNPSPEEQKVKHPVVVRVMPAGAASVSPSGAFDMEENSSRQIYAYPNTGWHLTGWTVNGERLENTTSPIEITMGQKALDIVAYFTYNPESPSNPGANYYNPTTGQVIIDDFEPGYLYDAMNNLVGRSNFSNISSLIVKGEITSKDLGSLRYASNAVTIDISRTGGVSALPGYAFSSVSASSIILPSTISSLGNYVFSGCGNLASLTIYAQEPPVCSSYTFSDFPNKANCTVYVPAYALELYTDAEYWKDFTILPITDDAHVLQVNLPDNASDGRYKNYSLEIVNISSGVRQKYVISDRMLYTFNGLQKDEQYNIYLYSQAGLEIGRIENVVIPDKDIEVAFDNIKDLFSVFAKVTTPDGKDVTSQVSVEWLKPVADGTPTYLRKAVSLSEIPEGEQLICRVTLDNNLGVTYVCPDDVEYTVGSGKNICDINLKPFRAITLSGKVVDGDGTALSGASVSVNQTLNGRYSKTYTAKTDRKGEWSVSVLDAPETRLTFAASECVNVNDTIGAFRANVSTLDLGKTTLKSIVGARISYGFTYHAAGSDEVEDRYSDYQNVLVDVYNVTQNRAHKDVSLQYPVLAVLDENINAGDELRLTATSKTGAFNPIEETVTIGDDQRAEVTFDIVGKGGISASFEMTDNPAVIAMLYSTKGELLKKQIYSEAKTAFTGLEDGDYTLVSMGQSDMMSSILRLSNYDEIGLTEGKDYVKNAVKVETGKLTEVKIPEVPAFDESIFYYTNSTTGFSSNKSSITTGNFLTLRSAIDFKGVYKNDISNVALVVDLPEACDFVEKSVIQGLNALPYTFDNNRLTVPLGNNYQSQIRFCVIPTIGGRFNATASIIFDYNGKTITQPIGSANSEIKDIEISVPSVITSPVFKVSGTALGNSKIRVYEEGTLLGEGKANAAGLWNVECELTNPNNLSTHSIHAEITTPAYNTLVSETKTLTYDRNAIMVSKVTMYHWNPEINRWRGRMETSEFDFLSPKTSPTKWTVYYPKKVFTYTIEFTDNDPERISNVVLYVHTADGKIVPVKASFDESKGMWYAKLDMGSSPNGYYPVNCSVDFDYESEKYIDNNQLLSEYYLLSELQEQVMSQNDVIDEIYGRIKEELKKEIIDDSVLENLYSELAALLDLPALSDDDAEIDENELYEMIETFKQEYGDTSIDEIFAELTSFDYTLPEGIGNIRVTTCDDYDLAMISQDPSYVKFDVSDNKQIFVLATEFAFILLDFDENICYEITFDSSEDLVNIFRAAGDDMSSIDKNINEIEKKSEEAKELIKILVDWVYEFDGLIDDGIQYAKKGVTLSFSNLQKFVLKAVGHESSVLTNIESACDYWMDKIKELEGKKIFFTEIRKKIYGYGNILLYFSECINDLNDLKSLYNKVPDPCEDDQYGADNIREIVRTRAVGVGVYYEVNTIADVVAINGIVTSIMAAPVTSGSTLLIAAIATGKVLISYGIDKYYRNSLRTFIKDTEKDISSLKCKKKECGEPGMPACPPDPDDGGGNGGDTSSGSPDDNVEQDPSGFVYEAVPDNRVEGVQASIYYKETKEDMYGDPYEEIVLWDAEEYAQKNPLFTDENGMYRWDVPQGLWQVKFEKDGYVTAYSEWLPVPPPQLEVNIGIVQNKQPEVTEARAYEEGVEVQFDKYVDPSTLTAANIYVTANGEKLNGEIRLIDSALADEYASEEDANAVRYASRVRFVPEEKLSATTGEIRLTVSRNVLSYAGIPMTETFSQVLDVEKEVQTVYADDVKVLYGGEKEVTVYAMPFEAAVGRKLHIANSSDLIATTDITEAILDEEGKAVVKIHGDLPGRAQLTFTIDDVTATGECAVDVVTEIITAEAPKSSRASGTAVYRGTKIELTTESKNATIYFTTDGSCPCDPDGTRRKYTVPIVINEDTQIIAMASVGDSEDDISETVQFNYTLKHTDMDFQMEEGWTWISHNLDREVTPAELAADESVTRIVSQTDEVIRDPQIGMVGSLTGLSASQSYKVVTTAATKRQRISDVARNPETPLAVMPGWNWIGYPVAQTMTVDEAFATTEAETLDVIVGQGGFAQFDGEKWVGTLETMTPGAGYMYSSQSEKKVIFNTSIVSNAAAKYAAGISKKSPLVLDIHKYGTIMPVVATIARHDGSHSDNADYQVAAFCGTECRGIGRVVNGLVMMNVYGNANDPITFVVTDAEGGMNFANEASMNFSETVVGSIFDPYIIAVNDASGIGSVAYNGNIKVWAEGDMLRIKGIDAADIDLVEIYDLDGRKLLSRTHIQETGIRISDLGSGVYVVVVNGNGEYTYHKIAKY